MGSTECKGLKQGEEDNLSPLQFLISAKISSAAGRRNVEPNLCSTVFLDCGFSPRTNTTYLLLQLFPPAWKAMSLKHNAISGLHSCLSD